MCRSVRHSKKAPDKQYTCRSTSRKDKQLDYVFIDRRSRRYCTDAEANDMIHLGAFPSPMRQQERRIGQRRSEHNLYKKTRYTRQSASMETREGPEPSVKIQDNERRYDELQERFTGKHEATVHKEAEILERQQTTTTTAATSEEA